MRKKEMLFAAVIGGVIGTVLTMAAGLIAPLGAQNDVKDAVFESITCKRIWVVDEDGNLAVGITSGLVADRAIVVHDKTGKGGAMMTVGEHGGYVSVHDNVGTSSIEMRVTEYGGYIGVLGKGDSYPRVTMSVNEFGNGVVGTRDKNGYRLAVLGE